MQSCRICGRTYSDDDSFCPEDGSELVSVSGSGDQPTVVVATPNAAVRSHTRTIPNSALTAAGVGAAVIVASIGLFFLLRSDETSIISPNINTASNQKSEEMAAEQLRLERERLELERGQMELERERLRVQRAPANTPALADSSVQRANSAPVPSSGQWFVVLGSFPKSQYSAATSRVQEVARSGNSAQIVDTDEYPGLRNGLWAVVMGPYSKSDATRIADSMKSVRSDAYVRSGW